MGNKILDDIIAHLFGLVGMLVAIVKGWKAVPTIYHFACAGWVVVFLRLLCANVWVNEGEK